MVEILPAVWERVLVPWWDTVQDGQISGCVTNDLLYLVQRRFNATGTRYEKCSKYVVSPMTLVRKVFRETWLDVIMYFLWIIELEHLPYRTIIFGALLLVISIGDFLSTSIKAKTESLEIFIHNVGWRVYWFMKSTLPRRVTHKYTYK